MDNYRQIIKAFQKNGYCIIKENNLQLINNLQNKVIKLLKKNNKKKIHENNPMKVMENLHKYVNLNQINNLRLKIIDDINKNKSFRELYYLISKNVLELIVGNELAMQNKINLSIQMPNDKKSILPMHSDIYAGESPFEVVIWIPLVNIKNKSGSMFITNPKSNKKINRKIIFSKNQTLDEIYLKYKKKFKFLKLNYGEILIFSPLLMHGNIINKTKQTRISLNCRFKSLLSPYDVINKSHRNVPHFFSPLTIKPMTRIGFDFINKMQIKK